MGLFRRTKKVDEPSQDTEPVQEITPEVVIQEPVKSPEEIERERIAAELAYVKSELQSKTDHLNAVTEKLGKIKSEYDDLVGTLMASKREANEKKTEMDAQRIQHQQLLKQIDASKMELESTKRQIEEKKSILTELNH